MKSKKIIIWSRGSKLALIYAEIAKNKILEFCTKVEIKKITTTGDIDQKNRLSDIGGKGLFSKQIENDLLNKKIDIAVHALKDMPSEETLGLISNCFLKRNAPEEILITKENKKFSELNSNAIIGTSSYRREFQLKRIRNDLNYKTIRGNIDTRISKINNKDYDGIILAKAGIKSLDLDHLISQEFSTQEIIPSAGQGIVSIQCREDDTNIIKLLSKVNDKISTLLPIFVFFPITTYGLITTFFPNLVSSDKNTVSGDFIVTPIFIAWLRNFSCLYFSAKAIFFLFIDVIKISLYININFVITHKIFLNNTY